eukprot:scaffold38106_cov48-Prasinocladus_malaysianus.AAC.1
MVSGGAAESLEHLNSRAQVAECPVCTRSFRPRSLSRAWESVVKHVAARSRQGCEPHRSLHLALHRHGGRSRSETVPARPPPVRRMRKP